MSDMATIKIGPWTATPALNLLQSGACSVKIEPRAMDVLVVLAAQGGKVVSVEELIASVWKGVVVGDGSVYLAIRQLRQALDDPAGGARYIETIPKRGYRLTVPAELETIAPDPPATSAPRPRPARSLSRRWLGAFVVCAAVVAGIVVSLRGEVQRPAGSSVAVLPFENLSSDPEQAYFADGVTAEILSALSQVGDLRVIGQVSSFRFKGSHEDADTIGAALGVEHILEGSVRKAGEQVRIAAQLRHAETGEQVWSETYERRLDDIFVIQDEIAASVAKALQVKLGVGAVGRVPGMTRNVAAYDEYLRGIAALDGRAESFPRGIGSLQRAVALDPQFSIAWSRLAMASANGALLVPSRAAEWRGTSDEALVRARALTPDGPHTLFWMGILETQAGRWLDAARIFEQLDASFLRYGMTPQAAEIRGVFLMHVGRVREAVRVLERARAEEPLLPSVAQYLALARTIDGDYSAAFAEIDRGLALEDPDMPFLRSGIAIALNMRDRAQIHARIGALPSSERRGLSPYVDAPEGAAAAIRREASTANPPMKTGLAFWAAYFHEPELALELWTEGTRTPDALWQPLMHEVRTLPAFKNVVRELGLVDYWRAYGWPDFCHPIDGEDFACR